LKATGYEKNPDFENIGVHVYYIGGDVPIRQTM
jgi:hypothetical protein